MQMEVEEAISKDYVKVQQQACSNGHACCFKGQDCPCTDTLHSTMDKSFVKHAKQSQVLPQNERNVYNCSDEQTIQLLQCILTGMNQKKDNVGIHTSGPEAPAAMSLHKSSERKQQLKNVEADFNLSKSYHLPHSYCVNSNGKSTVVKVIHAPPFQNLTNKANEKKSVCSDFFEAFKEKLQQKDLENQQIIRVLLKKQQELRDVKEMSKLKEVEAQLMGEKLKREQHKNIEITTRFNNACEDMREKLSIANINNESFARQLKALMEKYERLKKRASIIKEQLLEERTKKNSSEKTFKKIQCLSEELLRNQALLEKQRDAATRELSSCRKKMDEELKKQVRIIQNTEVEKSAIRADYKYLRDELCKAHEENKNLTEAIKSKELEKVRAEENLWESQNVVKQLYAELNESKLQKESIYQQLEIMKEETKQIHNKQKDEILKLHERNKPLMKQFEGMRIECEALKEVSKLKKDKHMLKEQLQCLQKEKSTSEKASKCEGEKLREVVHLLERERALLLDEMSDLRKDYFTISDRITQRLGQLDQNDAPMCITDISSFYPNKAPKVDNTVMSITPSMDMIEHIKRKLEEEENSQQK